jgi:hypothetical protein
MARAKAQRAESTRRMLKRATLTVTNDGSHEMAVVPIADLTVDKYQRRPNQRRVDKIARQYDLAKAGVIEISYRQGRSYVFDGWHRVLGAYAAGETEMLAHIHHGLSYQDEARYFREINHSRLPIKSLEEFNAAIEEEHPKYLEIKTIVEECGGWVAHDPSDGHRGAIVAIKSIERVYDLTGGLGLGGDLGLRRVLTVIRDAFGSLHRNYAQADMVKGISAFIEAYSEEGRNPLYDRKRLIKKLQEAEILGIMQKAHASESIYGGSMWTNIARAIVPIYNRGLRDAQKLPEWGARADLVDGYRPE